MNESLYQDLSRYLQWATAHYPGGVPERLIDQAVREEQGDSGRVLILCSVADFEKGKNSSEVILERIIERGLQRSRAMVEILIFNPSDTREEIERQFEKALSTTDFKFTIFFGQQFGFLATDLPAGSVRANMSFETQGVRCILTSSLKELAEDQAKKRAFWEHLKPEVR